MRVLMVEDDEATAQALALMLGSEGFDVFSTDLGEEAIDLVQLYDYGVILLDLNLPDMSGYQVLRAWRQAGLKTPVIILSGLAGIEDKLNGLGFGADDYMTKPFHKDELVARMLAAVRRFEGHPSQVITGALVLDLNEKRAEVSGLPLSLTDREYRALELLSLRKGTTLMRQMFGNHLWGGMMEGDELQAVDLLVAALREKLAAASQGGDYIQSVWGRGYVLREPRAGR
jgi:two-component system cell cycle response regulator CtrA